MQGINAEERIIIIDAIMGAGKSTFLIEKILNKNPHRHYICVLKTLDECERYSSNINIIAFEPQKYGSKSKDFQRLIRQRKNIITTHSLIQHIDIVTLELLKDGKYTLLIDECLDVIHQHEDNFTASDLRSILNDGYATIDDDGYLQWNEDKDREYNGRYNDIRDLCKLHSLMCYKKDDGQWSESIVMWVLPPVFFTLFEKCYICTYLWNSSFHKAYFDMNKIAYSHLTLSNGMLEQYNPLQESETRKNYRNLINVYIGKLNDIGTPKGKKANPLCRNWYEKNKGTAVITKIKNNTYNYFRNIVHTPASENMFTVFESFRSTIKGKGYAKGFVACNAKATNDFIGKQSLAYLINYFPPTNIVNFFKNRGICIDQELFALSELLQWIWRSQIRVGKAINLYIPSQRMRELLEKWAKGEI